MRFTSFYDCVSTIIYIPSNIIGEIGDQVKRGQEEGTGEREGVGVERLWILSVAELLFPP